MIKDISIIFLFYQIALKLPYPMKVFARLSLLLLQLALALVATAIVWIVAGQATAGIFAYGCMMVLAGQACVWWVSYRTEALKKKGVLFDEQGELRRIQIALFIKFVVIAMFFVYAWHSDRLIQNPIALILGYLVISMGAVPISHLLRSYFPSESEETKREDHDF